MVLTSLKRGAPKAPSRLGRWAVRRFVWDVRRGRPRSLRVAARTYHPKGGFVPLVLNVIAVKCAVTLRPRWRCLPSPAWRYLAQSCRRQSSPRLAASPLHRHPKGDSHSILHLCVRNLSTRPFLATVSFCCTHATPTWRPPGPWPLLAGPCYCGTDVAEKGSAEGARAAGPLGGPAFFILFFWLGRATRTASLASRSGTYLPPEGWLCTVGA